MPCRAISSLCCQGHANGATSMHTAITVKTKNLRIALHFHISARSRIQISIKKDNLSATSLHLVAELLRFNALIPESSFETFHLAGLLTHSCSFSFPDPSHGLQKAIVGRNLHFHEGTHSSVVCSGFSPDSLFTCTTAI